ncbi:MAG: hypothetical protein ACYC1I_05980 [Acidimicrobiales bacterium]
MTTRTDEDLELELRSLPGVLSVSITYDDRDDVDVVTLLVIGAELDSTRSEAHLILSLYYDDATLVIEEANDAIIQMSRDHSRVAIVDAQLDHATGTAQVQLQYNGRTGIGHSASGPLIGGADATLAALRDLGIEVPFSLLSVNSVSLMNRWPVIVTLRSTRSDNDRMGIALSEGELLSSVKSTLNALNRFLATPVRPG